MAPTNEIDLSSAWAPLERLIAELEGRLRAQQDDCSDLRRLLAARGHLAADW